jgi:hypothetical protein
MAMATKTIPEYLEDERRNRADTELRAEEEAARIQSLHSWPPSHTEAAQAGIAGSG